MKWRKEDIIGIVLIITSMVIVGIIVIIIVVAIRKSKSSTTQGEATDMSSTTESSEPPSLTSVDITDGVLYLNLSNDKTIEISLSTTDSIQLPEKHSYISSSSFTTENNGSITFDVSLVGTYVQEVCKENAITMEQTCKDVDYSILYSVSGNTNDNTCTYTCKNKSTTLSMAYVDA